MQVFGINDGESFSTAVNFADNFGLTYPVLHDLNGTVSNLYSMTGISPYPRDVIIDQNGTIQYMHSEYDPQYMLQTVNDLLEINNIKDETTKLNPEKFELKIYPNPFNPKTYLSFTVIRPNQLNLQVVNILGQVVYSNIYKDFVVGSNNIIEINMTNHPSGVYFLNLSNGKHRESQKMILLQ